MPDHVQQVGQEVVSSWIEWHWFLRVKDRVIDGMAQVVLPGAQGQ